MSKLPIISLDEKWRYHNTAEGEDYSALDVDDSKWEWAVFTEMPIAEFPASDEAWVRQHFHLLNTDECIRYFLHCDICTFAMRFFIGGELIAEVAMGGVLDLEITDYVVQKDNLLAVAIECSERSEVEQTKELYLRPFFCDELD